MRKIYFIKTGFKLSILLAILAVTIATSSLADFTSNHVRNNPDGSQTLIGHVPLEVKNGTAAFKSHANLNINARIIMPIANQSQLDSLLKDIYDPKSPNYHHFLTPAQYAQQFPSSNIGSIQVQEFLKNNGITVTGQSPNGSILNVTGPSGAFEKAFGLRINYYQKSDGTLFYAPDADPTIPANIAGKILAVGGLDNLKRFKPL